MEKDYKSIGEDDLSRTIKGGKAEVIYSPLIMSLTIREKGNNMRKQRINVEGVEE